MAFDSIVKHKQIINLNNFSSFYTGKSVFSFVVTYFNSYYFQDEMGRRDCQSLIESLLEVIENAVVN